MKKTPEQSAKGGLSIISATETRQTPAVLCQARATGVGRAREPSVYVWTPFICWKSQALSYTLPAFGEGKENATWASMNIEMRVVRSTLKNRDLGYYPDGHDNMPLKPWVQASIVPPICTASLFKVVIWREYSGLISSDAGVTEGYPYYCLAGCQGTPPRTQ
ncbi:hypothetical protein P691DRAFT_790027 [Macrolepiota fuliginosa MF-IS2]|uniref:Uncharacterized protein n=1 Tax=Macrolepiota fuliginosa MF-IS2 TaxID=1400762 RepID=A0A9P5XGT3_9AGAR|nr:hypothetical protein P691DRAFT_790027 [Macrolepiota fuliginosa MF-IS2]